MALLTFQEALEKSDGETRNVLLGNGFSMAYSPGMFSYRSLLRESQIENKNKPLWGVFQELGSDDFEEVMEALRTAAQVASLYDCNEECAKAMNGNSLALRDLLVEALAGTHPRTCNDITDRQYRNTRLFLSNFNTYFTTNYDLLLYWTLLRNPDGLRVPRTDGFLREDEEVYWTKGNSQDSFYLHGALHFYKKGVGMGKLSFDRNATPLTEQIKDRINQGKFPSIVSEGSTDKKIEKIEANKYLRHCLRKISTISGALFIHGHSFSKNDAHIWDALSSNSNISTFCVGIHGDEENPRNKNIKLTAKILAEDAKASIEFYDSSTANLWNE